MARRHVLTCTLMPVPLMATLHWKNLHVLWSLDQVTMSRATRRLALKNKLHSKASVHHTPGCPSVTSWAVCTKSVMGRQAIPRMPLDTLEMEAFQEQVGLTIYGIVG